MKYPGMQQQDAIEFFFLAKATSLWGFYWLIEWSTSSFYVEMSAPWPAVGEGQPSRPGP
jgi:hypothetical protein